MRNDRVTLIVRIALVVGLFAFVGSHWLNRPSITDLVPPTAGITTDKDGLDVQDVYLVKAPAARQVHLVATMVAQGKRDTLQQVSVDGRRADLTCAGPTVACAVPVGVTLTTIRPPGSGGEASASVGGLDPDEGTTLPVVMSFADRGDVTIQAPVWPSQAWPGPFPSR